MNYNLSGCGTPTLDQRQLTVKVSGLVIVSHPAHARISRNKGEAHNGAWKIEILGDVLIDIHNKCRKNRMEADGNDHNCE
jgi:hypothetical protein